MRDGRIVMAQDDIAGQTQVYQLEGDPEQKTVAVMLSKKKSFTITLTDEPRSPEPPAQTGSASSLAGRSKNSADSRPP